MVDECGECGGNGPSIECTDGTFMCNPESCGTVKSSPNFPNPFNDLTSITFYTKEVDSGKFIVYDIKGKRISTTIWNNNEKEYHTITWNGLKFPSGIYIYKIKSNKGIEIAGKMILIK